MRPSIGIVVVIILYYILYFYFYLLCIYMLKIQSIGVFCKTMYHRFASIHTP